VIDGVGERRLNVVLLGLTDETVRGQRAGAQQQPDDRPRQPDGAAQVVDGRPAQRTAAQRAGNGQRDHGAQLYAAGDEPDQLASLVRRCPLGHDAMHHGEHERRRQALREPDGHQGGGAVHVHQLWADDGQHRRDGHAARQQRLVVKPAPEHGRRKVGQQVADEKRAQQHRPRRVGPPEYRHVVGQLSQVVRRVDHGIHGHDSDGQVHPDQVPANHAQEQQQALQVSAP